MLGKYYHTLKYLRPVQFYERILLHFPKAMPDCDSLPCERVKNSAWVSPAVKRQSFFGEGKFFLLNEHGAITKPCDWNMSSKEKLWLYNLHYFDDLTAEFAERRSARHRALIDSWIRDNPVGVGVGWEPYPVSMRIVNWIKWALAGNELSPHVCLSLAIQARWLSCRLERHLLGNHLFSNAKALVFAGCFFSGDEASQWLDVGLSIINRELGEQILADGGQFERSPMYQALALEDIFDLLNIVNVYQGSFGGQLDRFVARWHEIAGRMEFWLLAMCHPDGEISFFNDAAQGIAVKPKLLIEYRRRLGLREIESPKEIVTHLDPSGYIRVQQENAVAILDVAPVGPDYLPGHAHADTLSFEMSLYGGRFIVNSGISRYGRSLVRQFERSTAAHSTVEIDGENSSEVWGGFRVARRARPFDLDIKVVGDSAHISCSHDGYRRLLGRPLHRRSWSFGKNSLEVFDEISGSFTNAISYFHLHPLVFHDSVSHGFSMGSGEKLIDISSVGIELKAAASNYHPEFGVAQETFCLAGSFLAPKVSTRFIW